MNNEGTITWPMEETLLTCGAILVFGLSWAWLWGACLAFLLAFYPGLYLFTVHAKRKHNIEVKPLDVLATIGATTKFHIAQTVTTASTAQTIKFILVFALGGAMGFLYRDHQLAGNIKTRSRLEVAAINAAGNFDLLEENGKTMHYNPCPGSHPPWLIGMQLAEIRFEQRSGCKRLEYFSLYTNHEGNAQIGALTHVR